LKSFPTEVGGFKPDFWKVKSQVEKFKYVRECRTVNRTCLQEMIIVTS
jgi:hypothetical protein